MYPSTTYTGIYGIPHCKIILILLLIVTNTTHKPGFDATPNASTSSPMELKIRPLVL